MKKPNYKELKILNYKDGIKVLVDNYLFPDGITNMVITFDENNNKRVLIEYELPIETVKTGVIG